MLIEVWSKLYDIATALVNLKVRLLMAEVSENLMYRCLTWTINATHDEQLLKAHLTVLLRVFGFQRRADHNNLRYAKALTKIEKSIETTIGKQRLLFAGAMVRQHKERSPRWMMYAQNAGEKKTEPGGPPNYWLGTLRDDLAIETSSPLFDPPKALQNILNGRFELKLCFASMEQTRRPRGTGESTKQANRSWPGITQRGGKKARGATKPACVTHKAK